MNLRERAAGGVSGFTLVELMFVTVLLGILAAVALPVYQNLRANAARGALSEQLRTLAQAQRMHFLEHDVYTDDVDDLDYRPARDLGLEIRLGSGGGGGAGPGDGWSARLSHPGYGVRCAVFYGDGDPYEPASAESEIACDDER